MKSALFAAATLSMMIAGRVAAQEATEERRPESRPQIRVLQDPYDLASFYRSGGTGYGTAAQLARRHPIASYYRGEVASRNGAGAAWGGADVNRDAGRPRWERQGRWRSRHPVRVKPVVIDDGEEP